MLPTELISPQSANNETRRAKAPGQGVLLLGASGFFGPVLADEFGRLVLARTYSTHAIEGGIRFDARTSRVADIVARLPELPEAAVIMIGETNIDACARDPERAAEVNVRAVIRVIRDLSDLGILPVFISSDAVFDGTRANWAEDEEVRPVLTYGRQKLEVERFLGSLPGPWLAVRLPKLLSARPDPRCMLSQWIDAFGRNDRIVCATDQYFTPAAASDAARAIAMLVGERAHGLYHLGGPERLSRRDLLQAALDEYRKFSAASPEIVECSIRDVRVLEPRPLDTSMRSERFNSHHGLRFRSASEVARSVVRSRFPEPGRG